VSLGENSIVLIPVFTIYNLSFPVYVSIKCIPISSITTAYSPAYGVYLAKVAVGNCGNNESISNDA
jgi:hypothetical protein